MNLGSEFYDLFFKVSGGGYNNIATTVSIEIERVAQVQFSVCPVYVRLRCTE